MSFACFIGVTWRNTHILENLLLAQIFIVCMCEDKLKMHNVLALVLFCKTQLVLPLHPLNLKHQLPPLWQTLHFDFMHVKSEKHNGNFEVFIYLYFHTKKPITNAIHDNKTLEKLKWWLPWPQKNNEQRTDHWCWQHLILQSESPVPVNSESTRQQTIIFLFTVQRLLHVN